MKQNLARIALAFAIVFSLTAFAQTGSAAAATAPAVTGPQPTKVGIINIEAAIVASNEGQVELGKLRTRFEPKQSELEKQAKEIDDLQKQLNTQGEKLNDATREQLRRSLETKQRDYKRALEDAQAEAQAAQGELLNKVGNRLMPVLDKYAKENGYALILDSSQAFPQGPLLWAGPSVDLTKTIVDLYNKASGVAAPPPGTGAGLPSAPKPATGTTARPAGTTTPRPPAGSNTPKK